MTHALHGAGVFLRSASVDLTLHEGQLVQVTGALLPGTCDAVDVGKVVPAPSTLQATGLWSIGCGAGYVVGPPGDHAWGLFLSTQPGFQPVDPVTGTILIGNPAFPFGSGVAVGGVGSVGLSIPNNLALVNTQVYGQAVRVDLAGANVLELTNMEVRGITIPLVPCGGSSS